MGGDPIVVRRGEHGWQVGTEETADLTSAMVLADLLAADLGTPELARTQPAARKRGPVVSDPVVSDTVPRHVRSSASSAR